MVGFSLSNLSEILQHTQFPAEWKLKNLGDCCFVTKLAGFEYTLYFDYSQGGEIIAIRVLNIKNGHFDFSNIQTIPLAVSKKLPRSILNKDDLVISYVGTVGEVALVEENHRFHLAPNVAKISPKQEIISSRFLLHQLMSQYTQKHLIDLGTLTSQQALSMSNLRKLSLIIPHLLEQHRITEILDTVDTEIQTSERLIAKLKLIQTGLLQTLLTCGIDENGEVRDPIARAKEFKYTEIGKIPEEWVSHDLSSVCIKITDGTHQSIKTSDHGIPFLFVSCVRDSQILWDKSAKISEDTYKVISKGREPRKGLILYTVVGSYGYAALVEGEQPFSFQRHIAYILPNSSIILPEFLLIWLNSSWCRSYADRVALGNAQKTVTLGNLLRFPVLLPCKQEQQRIVAILNAHDNQLGTEESYLAKLRLLKQGLMNDLLTGHVRVTELSAADL